MRHSVIHLWVKQRSYLRGYAMALFFHRWKLSVMGRVQKRTSNMQEFFNTFINLPVHLYQIFAYIWGHQTRKLTTNGFGCYPTFIESISSAAGYEPICMTEPAAPDSLLKFISCNCKTGCSSQRCSCKKNNVRCVTARGHCQGKECKNIDSVDT